MPAWASNLYGYQSTPQSEAPARSAIAANRIISGMQVDVSVVTYRTPAAALHALAASLAEQSVAGELSIHVFDNSESPQEAQGVCAQLEAGGGFAHVGYTHSPRNAGFGCGHNANAKRG